MTTVDQFFSARFHYTFGPHDPTIRIDSGQSLCVVCPDSDNALADGTILPRERRQISHGSDLFEGNPVAGPIYVNGAEQGSTLAIRISNIELDRNSGRTLLAPGHGLLTCDELLRPDELLSATNARSDAPLPEHMYEWTIDPGRQTATTKNPIGGQQITVPLRPMVGTVGVCPPWGQSISTILADAHGGNMDLAIIRAGVTLLLPVFCPGGLLMLGDLHAAQGEGEIIGGGIETSGRVSIIVRHRTEPAVQTPMVITSDAIYAVKSHGDLRTAIRGAYAHQVDWLAREMELNRWDAYQLVSQVGRLEIGGMTARGVNVVAAGVPLETLPHSASEAIRSIA